MTAPEPPARRSRAEARFELGLAATRGLVFIPVVILAVAALGAFTYATITFIHSVREVVDHPFPVGNKVGLFLLVIDLFLIGATMLIAAIGFYELFINRVDAPRAKIPGWLVMHDLNDLKARVIAMIVLVAAVSFVELLVDFRSGLDVLEVGAGVGLVIGALTVFMRFGTQRHGEP
jgi:uncharacterized membrane protein YqhA